MGTCNGTNECEYTAKPTTTACGSPAACQELLCKTDGTCGTQRNKADCCIDATACGSLKTACYPTPVCNVTGSTTEGTCDKGSIKDCDPKCSGPVAVQAQVCGGTGVCSPVGASTQCEAATPVCDNGTCIKCTGLDAKCPSKVCATDGKCCAVGVACVTTDCGPLILGCPSCSCGPQKTCQKNGMSGNFSCQ